MFDFRLLRRMDFRVVPVIMALMLISLVTISSHTPWAVDEGFFTHRVARQLQHFVIGAIVFVLCAALDYSKIREITWPAYALMLIALAGLFFTSATQSVHRWYNIPFIHFAAQPSEFAKLVVVFALSWTLERCGSQAGSIRTCLFALLIVFLPFLLILKQPDLGTALILWPIALAIFYFGGVNRVLIRFMTFSMGCGLLLVLSIFLGLLSHETLRPLATNFVKEYQYERLNPTTHHGRAAAISIALGGVRGSGWRQAEFSGQGWLPEAATDSIFPSFGEEFGLLGMLAVLALYYAMVYFGFQATAVAKDHFGRLLSAGITVYLAMHVIINIAMMCGLLPITGVPLPLVSYGGSSALMTMAALGIVQSVHCRRFMF